MKIKMWVVIGQLENLPKSVDLEFKIFRLGGNLGRFLCPGFGQILMLPKCTLGINRQHKNPSKICPYI
jgi:hypothetical protein